MSDSDEFLELIPAFALGCLEAAEAAAVAEHLISCATCQAEFQSLRASIDQLALAAPEAAPHASLRGRLLERVGEVPLPSRPAEPAPALNVWGAVALLAILALIVSNVLLWQRSQPARHGEMQAIAIPAGEGAPEAAAIVVIAADGRNGALVADRLPVLSDEQEYQVWLLQDGQRDSAGLFSVREDGYGGLRLVAPRSLREYQALGVTIEPKGGSPGPTGDRVLFGSLRQP